MVATGGPVRSIGIVTGPFSENETLVCQHPHMVNPKSIYYGHNPFDYALPILLAQLSLIFFATRITHWFLRPLGQSTTTAQIIAGVILGPTILGHFPGYVKTLFPPDGKVVLQTLAEVGLMFHLFLIGVQMDTSILKKAGRNAVIVGAAGFVLPYAFGGLAFFTISRVMTLGRALSTCIPFILALNAMTSFAVISSLLRDLNVLNSELGRLATSISMVSDFCGWFMAAIMTTVGITFRSPWLSVWSVAWIVMFLGTIFFILQPLVIWIAKHTPEGEPMKETHFFAILVLVLGCAFCAEVLGQHAALGPFILGIAVPDGPPLGTTLVYKLDALSTGLLLPVFFAFSGLQTNLFSIGERRSALILECIIILGYVGKFTGTIMAALYCNVPFGDALALALIMCCKGIIEVTTYIMWKDSRVLNNQAFSLLIITMLIVTGIARPIVGRLYDPSTKYIAYRRKTILHSKHNAELRVLVCIHNQDNVDPMINLLEASNPTRFSTISVFVLHLMELTGRASAILAPLNDKNKLAFNPTNSDRIINAFNHYENHNQGRVIVQHYAAIAPYPSMHDDICTLAVEKRANIVIVPFHKQFGAPFPFIRTVNQNVIKKAPCSVGVLVDRNQIHGNHLLLTSQSSLYRIALLFLGGTDDHEALAYARRLAEHPKVSLTVVWLKPWESDDNGNDQKEKRLDIELMTHFRANAIGKERIFFKEEYVKNGVGTTQIIRSMEDDFDLLMVGKHHDPESPFVSGLTEWSECPELGVIGDLLATSDFRPSVLVVQQQPVRLKPESLVGKTQNLPVTADRASEFRVHPDADEDEGSITS